MEEMSIDFDIEDDLIKGFLLHKLEEIKLNNSELEQQISRRKELLNGCVERMASEFSQNVLEITGTWQRNLNGKWIIGVGVKKTSCAGSAKNINVVLKWNSSTPLTYTTKLFYRYKHSEQQGNVLPEKLKKIAKSLEKTDNTKLHPLEDEWISTDEVKENLSIILAFEIPQFVEKSEYNISGIISYQFKEKFCQLNIPRFEITARDVTNNLLAVNNFDVINGGEEAHLSTLITNEKSELVVRVSQNAYTSLENIFEFELMFRKANIVSRTKKFFCIDNIMSFNDGYLLVLEKDTDTLYNMNIFSRDQTSLQRMLHFLYQHISDIIILPKRYKENLLEVPPNSEFFTQQQTSNETVASNSTLKEFGKTLELQISLAESFWTKRLDDVPEEIIEEKDELNLNVNIDDYQNFRKQLSDLELNSDSLYTKIEKFTVKSEPASGVDIE